MKALLVVAAGGALGATLRYGAYLIVHSMLGQQFPFATLIVNVVGSFLMGVLVEAIALIGHVSEALRLFLAVGVLGALTTFSAFALDFAVLYRRGALLLCALYVIGSVTVAIAALFAGIALARRVIS